MGGAPGEHVGTVIGVDGESLHMQQEGAGEVWIPLAWVSWTDDRTIHLSKTASEFAAGAEQQAPSRQVRP